MILVVKPSREKLSLRGQVWPSGWSCGIKSRLDITICWSIL